MVHGGRPESERVLGVGAWTVSGVVAYMIGQWGRAGGAGPEGGTEDERAGIYTHLRLPLVGHVVFVCTITASKARAPFMRLRYLCGCITLMNQINPKPLCGSIFLQLRSRYRCVIFFLSMHVSIQTQS